MNATRPIRPTLTLEKVRDLLQTLYPTGVQGLVALDGGQTAQAFSFVVENEAYVIRFSAENLTHRFHQERHIAQTYGSSSLPIPLVTHIGEFEGQMYGISEKADGQALDHHPSLNQSVAMVNLIVIHDAILQADISQTTGYGWWHKAQWAGLHDTWHEHIAYVSEEEPEGRFYHQWHHLFDGAFLEKDRFESVYKRMTDLLPYCPEDRYLVHGGLGFHNVVGHADGTITAVVDWTDSRYGDFVFDVAYTDFWWDGDIADHFLLHWQTIGLDVPHFQERVLCYQLYTGLDGMRFFAKIGNKDAYDYTLQRISRAVSRYSME
jgi:hygromycin-B 4-O-kinase